MRVKLVRIGLAIVASLGLLVGGLWLALRHPRPAVTAGPAADELARRIEVSADRSAWERTGAVRWFFGGRNHHLWDRKRQLDRVSFGDHVVLVDLNRVTGRAFKAGPGCDARTLAGCSEIGGAAGEALVRRAYKFWINDSFWLNPLVKFFDPGVERLSGQEAGGPALMIRYSGGGLTPGDSYLWLIGPDGLPRAWRMWVSIIPIGGIEMSWEGWTRLATGAQVATLHQLGPMKLRLTEVAGAATLAELDPGTDPFSAIAAK